MQTCLINCRLHINFFLLLVLFSFAAKFHFAFAEEMSKSQAQYTLQISSFATEAEAQNKVNELSNSKLNAFFTKARINDKDWYRVNVGQFKSRQEASKFQSENKDKIGKSVFISRMSPPSVGSLASANAVASGWGHQIKK